MGVVPVLYNGGGLLYFPDTVGWKAKKKGKGPAERPEQTAILDELKAAAAKLGLKVREEKLLREVGYRVRSGRCRVGEEEVIFLDRQLPPELQIDVLIDELADCDLDQVYLSPATRKILDRVARRGTSENGQGDALNG